MKLGVPEIKQKPRKTAAVGQSGQAIGVSKEIYFGLNPQLTIRGESRTGSKQNSKRPPLLKKVTNRGANGPDQPEEFELKPKDEDSDIEEEKKFFEDMQAHLKQFERQLPPVKKKQSKPVIEKKTYESPSDDEALKLIEEYEIQIQKSKQKLRKAELKKLKKEQEQLELTVDMARAQAQREQERAKYKKLGLAAESKEFELQVHVESLSPTAAGTRNAMNAGTNRSSFLAESMDKKWRTHSRRTSNEHEQEQRHGMLPEIPKKKKSPPHREPIISDDEAGARHLPRKKIQRKLKQAEKQNFQELPPLVNTQRVSRQETHMNQRQYGTSHEESGRPSLKSLEIAYSEKRMARAKKQVVIQKRNNELQAAKPKTTGVNFGPPFGYYQKQKTHSRNQNNSRGGGRSLQTPAGSSHRTQERNSNEKKYLPPKARPPHVRDKSKPTLMGSVSSSDKPIVRVLRSPPSGQDEPSHQRHQSHQPHVTPPLNISAAHGKSYSDEATSTRQLEPDHQPSSPKRQYPSHIQVQLPPPQQQPEESTEHPKPHEHPELQIVQIQLLKHLRDLSPQQLNEFLAKQSPEMLRMSLDLLTKQQDHLKKQMSLKNHQPQVEKAPQKTGHKGQSPPPFEIQKQATQQRGSPFQHRQKTIAPQATQMARQKTNQPVVAQKQQSYYRIIQQQKTQLAMLQNQDPNQEEDLYNHSEKSQSMKRAITKKKKTSPLRSEHSTGTKENLQTNLLTPISKVQDEISEGDQIINEISKHYTRKSLAAGNQVADLRLEGSSRNEDLESVMLDREDEELKDTVAPIIDTKESTIKSLKPIDTSCQPRKSQAGPTFEDWYNQEHGLPPPQPFTRNSDSPSKISPTAALGGTLNGRKSVMPSLSQQSLFSSHTLALKKQQTSKYSATMTLQKKLSGSPYKSTLSSLSKVAAPALQVHPPIESPPKKQSPTNGMFQSPVKSPVKSSVASKRKSMAVSQTMQLQSSPNRLLKQQTSAAFGGVKGLKKKSPSRMSIMQSNTLGSENTFGAYTVHHLPSKVHGEPPRKSMHLDLPNQGAHNSQIHIVEGSESQSMSHDPFAHIQSLLHQAHKIMHGVNTHREEKKTLEEQHKKEEEERLKKEEEERLKKEQEELEKQRNTNALPHVVRDAAMNQDVDQLQADAQERVDRLIKHLERREEIRAEKLRRPDPIINVPEDYGDERVFEDLIRTQTLEQDILSSRLQVVTKQIKQLININRGLNPSEEVQRYIETLQDNSFRDYPSPKHQREHHLSKSVSPKLVGRGLLAIPKHLRDPTLRLYQSILKDERGEITLSYQDETPILPSSMHKLHKSLGRHPEYDIPLMHIRERDKSRSDISLTLEFMAKEREKALRYRLPLESNHLQMSDVKYPHKDKLDLFPAKQEVAFNLDEKLSPDFYRYDERILEYLTASKQAAETQIKTLKEQHDEMRQRCERVLGTYEYEKELERDIEKAQESINQEIVVRGKLKYLSKMFAEIDIQETMERVHEQRQFALQQRVEKILQAIGEVSTESDHLMFRINQMAGKYNDTDIVKQQLEMEFNLLQEKAKRLQINPIITQKQLVYKKHIDRVRKDIERCRAELDNERVLYEIKVNKFRHDTKVFRQEILQNQGVLEQKLRINENQRLIILDLMSAQEAYSEAIRTQHGDMREYAGLSNQARAGSHTNNDELLRDLHDEMISNLPVLPSSTEAGMRESNDDKEFYSGTAESYPENNPDTLDQGEIEQVPVLIDGRPSTVNKQLIIDAKPKTPYSTSQHERDLFTYSIVKHNQHEEASQEEDMLDFERKRALLDQLRTGSEALQNYEHYLLHHEM